MLLNLFRARAPLKASSNPKIELFCMNYEATQRELLLLATAPTAEQLVFGKDSTSRLSKKFCKFLFKGLVYGIAAYDARHLRTDALTLDQLSCTTCAWLTHVASGGAQTCARTRAAGCDRWRQQPQQGIIICTPIVDLLLSLI
eukprot:6212167-Pleurochrysis_carterae.AAC.4